MAHVDRARFPFVFDRHALGIDREAARARASAPPRRTHARPERVHRRIRHERRLTRERGLKPARRPEPRVLGRGASAPSEQMTRWRGPFGVATDSTRRWFW